MIHSYPIGRHDESFHSLNARYFYSLRPTSIRTAYKELFGTSNLKPSIDFACHLETYCANLSHLLLLTPTLVIDKYTLLRFYRHFFVDGKEEPIIKSMLNGSANTIHTRAGINASVLSRYSYPRYCPECALSDFENYKETYWRLSHQIPDVNICLEHGCLLHRFMPSLNQLSQRLFLYPYRNQLNLNVTKCPDSSIQYTISNFLLDIFEGKRQFQIADLKYHEKIIAAGFDRGNFIDQAKLQSSFINFFGQKKINEILPTQIQNLSWLADIIRRPTHFFHPLRHALVTLYTESLPDNRDLKINHPFGTSPWICYNKASDHYLKKVVPDVACHIDHKTNRLIGVFSCSCGMIYTKSFLKSKNGSNKEFTRIKEWGETWNIKLASLATEKLSFREIGRRLGTDAKTIVNFLTKKEKLKTTAVSDSTSVNRKAWTKLLSEFSDNKVSNARKKEPKLYAWLYRNDQQWLLTINKLTESKTVRNQLRLNWEELDNTILSKVINTITQLKSQNFKRRITKTLVAKIIKCEKYILNNNAAHLPLTMELLEQQTESIKDCQVRRVKKVITEMLSNNEKIVPWKVMKKAGLKKAEVKLVNNEIQKSFRSA